MVKTLLFLFLLLSTEHLALSTARAQSRYDTLNTVPRSGVRPGFVRTLDDGSGGLVVDTVIPSYTTGTVTSVGAIGHQGITIAGSPITSSGALTLGLANGSLGDSLMATTYLKAANNLSDIVSASTARTNLGLGSLAVLSSVDLSGGNATGIMAGARFPALTGDVSNSAGALSTTVGAIQNKAITLATGYLKYTGSAWSFDNSTFLTGNQTITLSGDVSGSGATAITTVIGANKVLTTNIADANVTLAKLANIADQTILGNNTGGSAAPLALTASQTKTVLSLNNVENTALSTWAGSSNITTLGTIATGVWSGTAIVYGKLALTGAILNADLAGSIAYSKLSLTGAILNADLAGSIAYSKLSLTGAILNADLAGSIAYSKLSLTGAILNADLAGSIALTKLANLSGTSLLIGSSASSAAVQEITLGTNLSMSGTTLNATGGSLSGLTANGAVYATSSSAITSTVGMTSGQLLIGGTSTPALATLTGTSNQITVTNGNNTITLATPQNIHTAATPQFLRLGLNQAADATASLALTQTALGTTSTDGLILQNTTAAASGAGNTVQYSPRFILTGTAYNSTSGLSETDKWMIENEPTTVAGTTTQNLLIKSSINGGAYGTRLTLTSSGGLTVSGFGTGVLCSASGQVTGSALTANSILFGLSTSSITGNSTNLTYDATNGFAAKTTVGASNTVIAVGTIENRYTGVASAAGFGTRFLFNGSSTTTAGRNMAAIDAIWSTATDASRTAYIAFNGVNNAAALAEWGRIAGGLHTMGVAGTLLGQIALCGNTSGTITITPSAAAGTQTYTIRDQGAAASFVLNNASGGAASCGQATLASGTVTVSTTFVQSNSIILLTDATTGALTNVGTPTVGTIVNGTSFVINSSNVLDASSVNWFIINR